MQSKPLARWLQDHIDMLGSIENEPGNTFHATLYEGVIDIALNGHTPMFDSVLESVTAHAVAVGRDLTDLLNVPQNLRARIWQRIGEEIDPEPAFVMLAAVDDIFVHISRVIIDNYLEATKLAIAAQSAEISRRDTESEQKVREYATEVTRANRELARLEQAKTDFIGIAAHELKTPLTLIRGYVNILQDLETGERAKSLVKGIGRGAERMNTIIEDMLDLSALDMKTLGLVLQKIKLKSVIGLIINQLHQTLEERQQTVELFNLDALPEIEADSNRIHQIFRQIISNAIKYTPDKGHITIIGRAVEATSRLPACIELTIRDTGVGIAPEDKEKIFDKFYRAGDSSLHSTGQTKFMGAGPGLGLAIVKGLVEAHGGQVRVESPGFDMQNLPGSIFKIVLPVQAKPQSGIEIKWLVPREGAETPKK